MKTIIYLIRHSEPLNLKKSIYNVIEEEQISNEKQPLSIDGEKKSKKLSQLKELQKIDVLWSSQYTRAISTAKYIAAENNIDINIDERFGERKTGIVESNETNRDYWLIQLYNPKFKGKYGENQEEVRNRMYDALKFILDENGGQTIAIVSHATAITFLLMKWCELKDAKLEDKKRCLYLNDKQVINDSFKTPEIFKLTFDADTLIDICRVNYNF